MTDYLLNFIQHWGQIDSFLASAYVWIGFFAIGSFFLGQSKLYEFAPFYGWAVVNLVFTVLGVFTPIPFSIIAYGVGGASVIALIVVFRRRQRLFPVGSLRMLALYATLILMVSAMLGSQWDEFSDWLLTPRLLLVSEAFPSASDAHLSGSLSAYPFGWHYVSYLASLLAGRFLENAGPLINLFMLLTFSFLSIRLIRTGLGREQDETVPSWALCSAAALLTTLFNTTFVQKVALTSYADLPTAMLAGLGAVMGWLMLGALAEGNRKEAFQNALQVGLLMMLLVNLKQSTVVMAVIVIGAIVLAGLRDPRIRLTQLLALLPSMVIPSIIIFVVWRYYVASELTAREIQVSGFSDWLIAEIPQILSRMLLVLSKKGAYLAMFIVIVYCGVRALVKYKTPFDRFAIIAAAIFLGHNAFLLFAYVTAFGKFDALRAASYWRYNMQIGMVGVAFVTYGLGMLWQKYGESRTWPKKVVWIPVILMVIAPLVFAKKVRFDRAQPIPFFRSVGVELSGLLDFGNKLLVLDPTGSGESAVITRYDLGDKGGMVKGYVSAYTTLSHKILHAMIYEQEFTHLLVHSLHPLLTGVVPNKMDDNHSYLLETDKSGGWKIIKTWERP